MTLAIALVAHYLPKKWYDVSVDSVCARAVLRAGGAMAALVIGIQYVALRPGRRRSCIKDSRLEMLKTMLTVSTFVALISSAARDARVEELRFARTARYCAGVGASGS